MKEGVRHSVVIPSYQSAQTIAACLEGVLNQQFDEPFEVIVVDSSTDQTAPIVREGFPEVTLIVLPNRTYPGTARNLGMRQAQGEVIVFLDSDCVPASDWLARMAAAHAAGYTIVGGAVLNGTPHSAVGWAGYFSEFREFLPHGESRLVDHVPTCNISYKASIFEDYGGFLDAFYPQEDLVFNWMLSRRGERILFDPAIQVAHLHRTRFSAYWAHQRRIGQVTAQVLRQTDLPGNWLARRRGLALAGLPLMAGLKFLRTLRAFKGWHFSSVWGRPAAWLLFVLGLGSWALGFGSGLKSPCIPAGQVQACVPLSPGHGPATSWSSVSNEIG